MKKLIWMILILCLLAFSSPCLKAGDPITYKVKIPVKLINLCPDVTDVRVDCQASSQAGFEAGSVVAHGQSEVVALGSNGSLNKILSVDMLSYHTKLDELAKSYYCYLSAKYKGEWIMFALIKNQDSKCVNKAGTTFRVIHYGRYE